MFRVVGLDTKGRSRQLSANVTTEEEARAIAHAEGIVTIVSVTVPPPLPPSRFPKLSGFALATLGFLGLICSTILGAIIALLAIVTSRPPPNPQTPDLLPGLKTTLELGQSFAIIFLGACIGAVFGLFILIACYRQYRKNC